MTGRAGHVAPLSDEALAGRLVALSPGALLTLLGVDGAGLAARLSPAARPVLRLDLAGSRTAEAATARILDDLAAIALATWPDWPPSPLAPRGTRQSFDFLFRKSKILDRARLRRTKR